MAKPLKNQKGFLILQTSRSEILNINPNNLGICDSCCKEELKTGYYIAVLNSWYCLYCFESWYNAAVRFSEDILYEEKKYNTMYHVLIAQNN